MENAETDSYKYSQLIFDKGAKTTQWKKDSLFNKRHWKKEKTNKQMALDQLDSHR